MSIREYKLAGDPLRPRHPTRPVMREIEEFVPGMPPQVVLVIPNEVAIDVVGALQRAYRDGREDRAQELLG